MPWRSGWRITTPSGRTARSAICRQSPMPNSALPKCNGTGRCATLRAPRPVPLHHRANRAQMKPGLRSLPDEIRGSAHRNHTPAFKARVALAVIKGDRTLAQLAEQFDVHPNQITSWKAQLEEGAADVFGPGGGSGTAQPAVDVKSLHAKIGELTLENDFLEGALSKAGLLSAKR